MRNLGPYNSGIQILWGRDFFLMSSLRMGLLETRCGIAQLVQRVEIGCLDNEKGCNGGSIYPSSGERDLT
jgi:hypothetical protein